MSNDPVWFEKMAAAIKQRDRALTGIARWQESLAAAEAEMAQLAAEVPAVAPAPAPVTEPDADPVDEPDQQYPTQPAV
jgi:hypothetical protein